ncbi:MAG: riboflavin kinase, partial [Anaerolineae bacterium]|nr:riboflavin kinase [Anaerolineae bacterium]
VYAGTATVGDRSHIAAISVGTNPTFEGARRTVEAYLLDFDGDLYGQRLRVGFTTRLRDTLAFDGIEQLVAQMDADVERVNSIFRTGVEQSAD